MRAPRKWCDILKGVRVQEWKWSLKQAGLHMIKIYSAKLTIDVPNRWSQIILPMLCHAKIHWNPTRNTVLVRATFIPTGGGPQHVPLWESTRPRPRPWLRHANLTTPGAIEMIIWYRAKPIHWKFPRQYNDLRVNGHFQISVLNMLTIETWHDLQVTFNSSSFNVECGIKDESRAQYAWNTFFEVEKLMKIWIKSKY